MHLLEFILPASNVKAAKEGPDWKRWVLLPKSNSQMAKDTQHECPITSTQHPCKNEPQWAMGNGRQTIAHLHAGHERSASDQEEQA